MRETYLNLRKSKFKYLSRLYISLCLSLALGISLSACGDRTEVNPSDGEADNEIAGSEEEEAGTVAEAGEQAEGVQSAGEPGVGPRQPPEFLLRPGDAERGRD